MTNLVTVSSAEDLARHLVEIIAPKELPAFAVMAAPYLQDPFSAEQRLRKDHDDPLEFGLGDVAELATPVIVLVSASVMTELSEEFEEGIRVGATRVGRKLLNRFRRRKPTALPVARWTPGQLAKVHEVALAKTQALGMKPAKAEVLADAVVGALARHPDEQ